MANQENRINVGVVKVSQGNDKPEKSELNIDVKLRPEDIQVADERAKEAYKVALENEIKKAMEGEAEALGLRPKSGIDRAGRKLKGLIWKEEVGEEIQRERFADVNQNKCVQALQEIGRAYERAFESNKLAIASWLDVMKGDPALAASRFAEDISKKGRVEVADIKNALDPIFSRMIDEQKSKEAPAQVASAGPNDLQGDSLTDKLTDAVRNGPTRRIDQENEKLAK